VTDTVPMPALLVLTDRTLCTVPLVEAVSQAVRHGARAVVLREKDLPWSARVALAQELREQLEAVGGLLIMGGPKGDAVHLSATDPVPVPRPSLLGRSCHSGAEVVSAAGQGCDYVTVSPVFATPSKPGYGPALGLDGLAELTRLGPPAYALGGVRPEQVRGCLDAGARGVAVLGPIMREPRIVSSYLASLQEVAQ
jgi:thiamine-phosphate pyrophosphorylase